MCASVCLGLSASVGHDTRTNRRVVSTLECVPSLETLHSNGLKMTYIDLYRTTSGSKCFPPVATQGVLCSLLLFYHPAARKIKRVAYKGYSKAPSCLKLCLGVGHKRTFQVGAAPFAMFSQINEHSKKASNQKNMQPDECYQQQQQQ